MQLSREETAHVAWLARLALTDDELDRFAGQLSAVLSHIDKLREVDVTGVEPMTMAVEADDNVWRADVPGKAAPRDEILLNAADTEAGAFRVRAILEDSH